MSLVCAQCSRVNPSEAAYCYHDGAALAGRAGGPINPGAALFPTPFVFPNGQACRNFDQLAITCQQNWAAALDLLKQGFLSSFFGGLGRVDLAVAAQESAKFPDPDRGLDQLLAKLPSQVVEAPKLQAEPSEINLGQVPIGTDRALELHLSNKGMRLLYGSVATAAKWLALGDAPGQPQKVFQFGDEAVIAVQVKGQHLRAGIRPLEGELVIDSNGGSVTVKVRADVPVTPFAGGLFDGAVTPRQIAEKAKAHPKEAAPYFEDGRVAAWFQSNGWTYPVQGPPMSGMGAVQQFFEALGVAKPPQVQVSPPSVQLEGEPGKVFHRSLEVTSPERKVVYGWATSDQPWVAIGKTKLTGRSASIPITVTVPDRAGTQVAQLTVVGNGQQRFTVAVAMAVIGGAEVMDAEVIEAEVIDAEIIDATQALEAELIEMPVRAVASVTAPLPVLPLPAVPKPIVPQPTMPQPAVPQPTVALPARPASVPHMNLDSPATATMTMPAAPAAIKAVTPMPVKPPLVKNPNEATVTFAEAAGASAPAPSLTVTEMMDLGPPAGVIGRPPVLQAPARPAGRNRWVHAIPAALLLVALFGTCMRDAIQKIFFRASAAASDVDTTPQLGLNFDFNFTKKVDNAVGNTMMAGLVRHDPKLGKGGEPKRLTYGRTGHTNSVVVRIDGKDRVFGKYPEHGVWSEMPKNAGPYPGGKICAFRFMPEQIVVTQEIRIVPGEPIEVSPTESRRLLDTCLFRYKIENKDNQAREVGLRFLLDTYIGTNDEVPFTLPGVPGMVDTFKELKGDEVPDFIQVLERPDLKDPGLIAQLNLRVGESFEPPNRIKLTAHPIVQPQKQEGLTKDSWEIPLSAIKEAKDSCVVLYWDPVQQPPGSPREMAFTYGLGNVSVGPSAKLGLTVGGAMLVGRELTVVALVADAQPDQTVELTLPPGLVLSSSTPAVQKVPPSTERNKDGRPRPSPVTWRVRAQGEGSFPVVVETQIGGETVRQERRVAVKRAKQF
jgi:hypothetical protein